MKTTQTPALSSALDAFFDWYYRTNPVNATFIGVHDYDHRLPDFSPRGTADTLSALETLAAKFRQLPREQFSGIEHLDRRVVEGALDIYRWEAGSRHFHLGNPCVYTGEAIFGIIALLLRPFAPLEVRVQAAVERMKAIPEFLAQGRANLRRAPGAWTERAIRECEGALALFEHGVDILVHQEGAKNEGLRPLARTSAAAFREFRQFLSTDLRANATEDYACGAEVLNLLLRRGHFLDMDAAAVLALGRQRLTLAEARLRERAAAMKIGDWRDGLRRLAALHPTAKSYYARFAEIWDAARAAAEGHALVSWPDYPIQYVPQPAWAREAAPYLYFLFYRAPAAFDRVPVVEYLVTPVEPEMPPEEQARRLQATNDSVIKLNHVIHHGGLGHHIQNWYAYNRAASRVGRMAAVDCAGRIAMYCGGTMAEGWACYATDIMDEIEFLTPLERLSHAQTHLRMAARAVADIQLHTGAWSLDETTAFYRDTAGMPPDAARAEAVKNSMFPGVALMYLCGSELIHDLRRDTRAREPDFDLRRFHDRFLSYGSLPVALIAADMGGSAA